MAIDFSFPEEVELVRQQVRKFCAEVVLPAEKLIALIRRCPSGALSFSKGDVEQRELDAEPDIAVAKGGPYVVRGCSELTGVPRGEGAAEQHFTLCRCGASKNKPFCDGTHWNVSFDEAN